MIGNLWNNIVTGHRPPTVPLSPGELEGTAKVVGVFSPAPGAGAATFACLCSLLASGEGYNTALADLHPRGKVRAYMGLTPDVCPDSILDIKEAASPDEVERVGIPHPLGVFVVPGVTRPLDAEYVDSRLSLKAVAFLKQKFDVVFAVLGPLYRNGWAVAMVCDRLYAVVRPCRVDLDMYAEDMELLEKLGCSRKTKVVLNQVGLPGTIMEDDVKEMLSPAVVLPYLQDIQSGSNRRCFTLTRKVRKSLSPVVHELAGLLQEKKEETKPEPVPGLTGGE